MSKQYAFEFVVRFDYVGWPDESTLATVRSEALADIESRMADLHYEGSEVVIPTEGVEYEDGVVNDWFREEA